MLYALYYYTRCTDARACTYIQVEFTSRPNHVYVKTKAGAYGARVRIGERRGFRHPIIHVPIEKCVDRFSYTLYRDTMNDKKRTRVTTRVDRFSVSETETN